jgi:hypothetical protein
MSKIIQIASQADGPDYDPLLFALTDDGKVFCHPGDVDPRNVNPDNGEYWFQVPALPEGS